MKPSLTLLATLVLSTLVPVLTPVASAGLLDLDSDGYRNNIDLDTDGDGIPDKTEREVGLSPLIATDGEEDLDADGWTNAEEFRAVTDMLDPADNPDTKAGPPAQKLFPPFAYEDVSFGSNTAIDGDFLVVGDTATHETTRSGEGESLGAINVFAREDGIWQLQAVLKSDVLDNYGFGGNIDLQGDTLVSGAHGEDTSVENAGAVYIFVRHEGEWTQQAKLTRDNPVEDDFFGSVVALAGDQLLVGCSDCSRSGDVYVYDRHGSDWILSDTLTNCPPDGLCTFGHQIRVDGDRAVITAPHYNTGYQDGKAYVYQRVDGVWTQEAELVSTNVQYPFYFGSEADISGDTVMVADTTFSYYGIDGNTYEFVFENGEWTEGTVFYAEDYDTRLLGNDVALAGDRAVLSGYESSPGVLIEFVRDNGVWTEVSRFYSDGEGLWEDLFGFHMAIDSTGEQLVTGDAIADDALEDGGAVYVIDYSVSD